MVKCSATWRRRQLSQVPHRRNVRRSVRYPYRSCIRNLPGFRRGPDDLSQALTALRRAISAHRKLARLAPEFFDATVMNRLERRRKADTEWMALWQPALDEVYGPTPGGSRPRDPSRDSPRLPGPRTIRAVERELAAWRLWSSAGSLALRRYECCRQRALPSLTHIARLIEIGITLGRLACGEDDPDEEDYSHAQAFADLQRAYGHPLPDEEAPGSPADTARHSGSAAPHSMHPAGVSVQPPPESSPRPAADKRDLVPHALVVGPHGFLEIYDSPTSLPLSLH
jgi:hypothetical protein